MQPTVNPQVQTQQGIAALPLQAASATQPAQQQPLQAPQGQQAQTPEQILILLKQANDAKAAELAQREMALQQQMQPTVMQQLQQKAQQAPMQAPAPQPGGIDQVPSNLRLAGGGIVAFAGGGQPEMTDSRGDPYTHLWHAEGSDDTNTPYGESVGNALGFLARLPKEILQRLASAPGYGLQSNDTPAPKAPAKVEKTAVDAPQPEDTSVSQPPAKNKPTTAPAGRGTQAAGIRALTKDKSGAPAETGEGYDIPALLRKFTDVDPTAQRDADAKYVRDNSGLADEKLRRDKAREEMRAGQEGIKAARPTGLHELMLAMAEQGKANRGFRSESPFTTLLGDRAAAGVAMNKTKQTQAQDDYKMLVELANQGNADAAVQLAGNRDASEAGLKGADRARAQQTAGMQSTVQRADTLDRIQGRKEEMAMRMQEMQARANEAAASRGDNRLQMLLANSYQQAQNTAAQMARAAAEAHAKDPMNIGKPFDLEGTQLLLQQRILDQNAVYQDTMRKLGIAPIVQNAKATPTGKTRIKMDAQGNIIP